jgi:hypothetical protein
LESIRLDRRAPWIVESAHVAPPGLFSELLPLALASGAIFHAARFAGGMISPKEIVSGLTLQETFP